jgi:RNA polymerase sigma-70 factor, ECF subfamily
MAVMTAADPSPQAPHRPAIDWGRCLDEHQSWLKRVILARTGQPQAVDEVWQQLALAAVEQRWPLADPAKVAPWLHRLAVIAAARHCRQLGRQRRTIHKWADAQAHSTNGASLEPLALLMRRERVALTRHALSSLPARDAEMLLLKYGERWSYRRIAAHLGISERAVDCRLMRARAQLRRLLASLGVEDCEP